MVTLPQEFSSPTQITLWNELPSYRRHPATPGLVSVSSVMITLAIMPHCIALEENTSRAEKSIRAPSE